MSIFKYSKAIVAALSSVVATVASIYYGHEPDSIPGMAEALAGAITVFLVYFVPNKGS